MNIFLRKMDGENHGWKYILENLKVIISYEPIHMVEMTVKKSFRTSIPILNHRIAFT